MIEIGASFCRCALGIDVSRRQQFDPIRDFRLHLFNHYASPIPTHRFLIPDRKQAVLTFTKHHLHRPITMQEIGNGMYPPRGVNVTSHALPIFEGSSCARLILKLRWREVECKPASCSVHFNPWRLRDGPKHKTAFESATWTGVKHVRLKFMSPSAVNAIFAPPSWNVVTDRLKKLPPRLRRTLE